MEAMSTWENVLLGVMVILIIFWFRPGIKGALQQSRDAEKDWGGLLVPIGFVIMFVVFLIMMV
jgi:hypothetical protein